MKKWGRNHAILNSRPDLPRPKPPETVAMGPTKSLGNRKITIEKLTSVRDKQQPGGNEGGTNSAAATESEQPVWDEDDVMLFFWGNSMLSMERHAERERERIENINKWRAGTSATV